MPAQKTPRDSKDLRQHLRKRPGVFCAIPSGNQPGTSRGFCRKHRRPARLSSTAGPAQSPLPADGPTSQTRSPHGDRGRPQEEPRRGKTLTPLGAPLHSPSQQASKRLRPPSPTLCHRQPTAGTESSASRLLVSLQQELSVLQNPGQPF